MATKKYYATRDFNDAGTEKSFKAGDDVGGEPGIDNYVAAGLASEQKSDVVQSTPSTPSSPGA